MHRRGILIAAIAAVLSVASVQRARAATFDFQYGTTVIPSPINPSATVGGPGSQVSQAGIGNFATPTAPTLNADHTFGADITVGTVTVVDLAIGSAYDDTYSHSITVNLKIKDVASSATGTFTFTGLLTGEVTSNGSTISAVFNNPFPTPQSQTQTIGGILYDVSIDPTMDFTPPGTPPNGQSGTPGQYSFNVHAFLPSQTPAPAAFWAGLALIGALAAGKSAAVRFAARS